MKSVIAAYFCVGVLLCWLRSQPGDVPISGFIPAPDTSLDVSAPRARGGIWGQG